MASFVLPEDRKCTETKFKTREKKSLNDLNFVYKIKDGGYIFVGWFTRKLLRSTLAREIGLSLWTLLPADKTTRTSLVSKVVKIIAKCF